MDEWENEGGSVTPSVNGGTPERDLSSRAPRAGRAFISLISRAGMATQARPFGETPRSYLLHALGRALDGAELTSGELAAAIPHPRELLGREYEAWEQLGHWARETDLRAEDTNYRAFHLDWLADLQSRLAP